MINQEVQYKSWVICLQTLLCLSMYPLHTQVLQKKKEVLFCRNFFIWTHKIDIQSNVRFLSKFIRTQLNNYKAIKRNWDFEDDIDFVLTDRAAYITVMKICKLMLTTVSHAKFQVVVEACSADPQSPNITQAEHSHALILQQALQFIPNPGAEVMTRTVGLRLGQQLLDQVL